MSRGSGTRAATEERFAQRAAQARGQRVRRWLVGLLVVALLVALGWAVGFSSLFATREVTVSGTDPADRADVEEIAERQVGTPLARVDGDAVASSITDEVPAVAHARVERGWPHTLRVKVTSRVPALAVRQDGGGFRLLDLDGVEIRTVRSAPRDVPTVSAESGAEVSGHGVRAAQGMLAALPDDLREDVDDVTVDSADQITFQLGRTKVSWGDGSSPDVKVRVIQVLLDKRPRTIDVSAPDTPVTTG